MRNIELTYALKAERGRATGIRNRLIELLRAVHDFGSISGAAEGLAVSYRHAWGELKRWEVALGRDLIVWGKGQRAQLTPFGARLLQAERQAQARLAPHIAAMHIELERAFASAYEAHAAALTLFASHDEAIARLRSHVALEAGLDLDTQFCGSVDAIAALNERRCTMAGFHVRTTAAPGSLAERTFRPLLVPGQHKLIGFAVRSQGLLVGAGNPLGLQALKDVVQRRARFVNRRLGTGTRLLLDELLAEAGLAPDRIEGYARAEPSHHAVAEAVSSGTADVGLGIEAVARMHGLDFVPLAKEHYYLACLKDIVDEPATLLLRKVLQSARWQAHLAALPGYEPARSGEVLSLKQRLPWWNLPPKRRRQAA